MNKKLMLILVATMALASCQTVPTEYTSPCACLYEPLNKSPEVGGATVKDGSPEGTIVT